MQGQAGLAVATVGFSKTVRRAYCTVLEAASLQIRGRVGRRQDLRCELPCLFQNRWSGIRIEIRESRDFGPIIARFEQVLNDEKHVARWRCIAPHKVTPPKQLGAVASDQSGWRNARGAQP